MTMGGKYPPYIFLRLLILKNVRVFLENAFKAAPMALLPGLKPF